MVVAKTLIEIAINERKIRQDQRQRALDHARRDPDSFQTFFVKATGIPKAVIEKAGDINEIQMAVDKMRGVDDDTSRRYSEGLK